ncbi:MAG: hypothetical protein V1663_04680 [archaeon]
MRYSYEIKCLMNNERYKYGKYLLNHILSGETPSRHVLNSLYGNREDIIYKGLEEFYSSFTPRLIREHDKDAPTEISDRRDRIERDPNFQKIQSRLLSWELPSTEEMRFLFGDYAESVRKVYRLFLEAGIKRKCGLSVTAHHNRVAGVAYALMNNGAKKEYESSAKGGLHDALEDLLPSLRYEDRFLYFFKRHKLYGLKGYDRFVNEYIPENLQENVILLTNHFDLILKDINSRLERSGKIMTKKNLMKELRSLIKLSKIGRYAQDLYSMIEYKELPGDVFQEVMWICYNDLYIRTMAQQCHNEGDYRTYQEKAIDLDDNHNGKDALDMRARLKNTVKMAAWAIEGKKLKSTWPPLNNHIREIMENALVYAEYAVIRDLLQEQSQQDFFVSALGKIRSLESVFYV